MRTHGWRLLGVTLLLCCACSPAPGTDTGSDAAGIGQKAVAIDDIAPDARAIPASRRSAAGATSHADAVALQQWQRDYQAAVQQHLQRLLATPDARSQLLAALLMHLDPDQSPADQAPAAQAWADAARLGPDDPLVAWLQALQCARKTPGCDALAGRERLQRLEPDNAAAWLMAMEDALEQGDPGAVDRYLAQAAQAGRYDLHWRDTGLLVAASLQQVTLPPRSAALARWQGQRLGLDRAPSDDDLATVVAQAIVAAQALPSYGALSRVCGVNAGVLPPTARRPSCLAVFARMADSDTLVARAIGLNQLVQLTADTAEGAAWRERLRAYHWLQAQGLPRSTQASDFLRASWQLGEVAALQAILAGAGQLNPPLGWLPQDPRSRALVTTGRPPAKR